MPVIINQPYQNRKGTKTERESETLDSGYGVWDETDKILYIHDGVTPGGVTCIPLSFLVPAGGSTGNILARNESGGLSWVAQTGYVPPDDTRTFALVTGVAPAKHYMEVSKTVKKAVVRPSSVQTGTISIDLKSEVLGSGTVNTIATLSVSATDPVASTTIDFTDAVVAAQSHIWAECADLKSGGTVSVSVVMQ